MTTLVYMMDEKGKVYCEQPHLRIGQTLDTEKYMADINKHMKAGYRYTKVMLVEETENFYSCKGQTEHIKAVIRDIEDGIRT